jgi:hypothetical protein
MRRLLTILMLLISLTCGVSFVSAQDATAEPTAEATTTPDVKPDSSQPAAVEPLVIEVGVYVVGVSEFQLDNGIYNADFYLTMHCNRPCTPQEAGIDVMGVSGSEGLNVELRIQEESYFEYRVQAVLAHNKIDLSRFPFDTHSLRITIESKFATADVVTFVQHPTENGVDQDVNLPGWDLQDTYSVNVTEKSYYGADLGYARYTFTMTLNRVPVAAFIRDVLPALVILFISFLGTFMPDRNQRIGLAGGILLAMLVHHLGVSGNIPAVAYPVYFDAFMLINDAAILIQFGFTVFELVLENRGTAKERLDRFSLLTLVGIIAVWVLAQIVIIPMFQSIVVN